jgi:hypothetical protein
MASSMLMSTIWAPFSTCWRATASAVVVAAFEDHAGEGFRAGDVGALADIDEQAVGADVAGLESREAQAMVGAGGSSLWRGGRPSSAAGDGADVIGRGAAAAAGDVDQARVRPVADLGSHGFRRFVVAAEGVRQAGVGMHRDQAVGQLREFFEVGPQVLGAQRAVEAEGQRPRVAQRVPEGLRRLAGERAAGGIGDGAGNHHRPAPAGFVEELLNGEQRGLGVERVEDRLHQQDVHAAGGEAAACFEVVGHQLVEGDIARAGVVDVGRERGGARGVGRARRRRSAACPASNACRPGRARAGPRRR